MEKAIVPLNKTEYNKTTLNLNNTPLTITSIWNNISSNYTQLEVEVVKIRKKKKLSSISSGWLSIPLAQIITFHDAPLNKTRYFSISPLGHELKWKSLMNETCNGKIAECKWLNNCPLMSLIWLISLLIIFKVYKRKKNWKKERERERERRHITKKSQLWTINNKIGRIHF